MYGDLFYLHGTRIVLKFFQVGVIIVCTSYFRGQDLTHRNAVHSYSRSRLKMERVSVTVTGLSHNGVTSSSRKRNHVNYRFRCYERRRVMVFELRSIESVSFIAAPRTVVRFAVSSAVRNTSHMCSAECLAFHSASENLSTRELTERSVRGNV